MPEVEGVAMLMANHHASVAQQVTGLRYQALHDGNNVFGLRISDLGGGEAKAAMQLTGSSRSASHASR
ncbi:hypothetical protein IP79_13005 [Porphyrobacter sp. AAP60]|nr:hypothetical protein IP79_13005 [Porphyrobacter sp. AAP60]